MIMEFKKVMLGLGVGILAALFIGFLIDAIYPNPRYNDFCSNQYQFDAKPIQTNTLLCNYTYNTTFRNECYSNEGMIMEDYDSRGCVTGERCDYCNRDYQYANEKYSRDLFYITAPIGLLMIILGLYLPVSIDAIAGGLLLGGILTMIQITMRIFGNLGKWPRVILLGLELGIVIWIGIKKVHGKLTKSKTE